MDDADFLPNDLTECHRLLLMAYKQAVHLEQQLADSVRRVAESKQRIAELDRVLNSTSASFEELQQEHTATLEELAWYKRWVHGRRRERVLGGKGQRHLFDLTAPEEAEASASLDSQEPRQEIAGHSRRYPGQRDLDLSRLPHHRHEQDLSDSEKICGGCGRARDRIGEDVTTILEYVPSKPRLSLLVNPANRFARSNVQRTDRRNCHASRWSSIFRGGKPASGRDLDGARAGRARCRCRCCFPEAGDRCSCKAG